MIDSSPSAGKERVAFWYRLLPFPLDVLFLHFKDRLAPGQITISDATLSSQLFVFFEALTVIEAALASREISCVLLGDEPRLAFFFHFVRRGCLRMWTSADGQEMEALASADSETLFTHLGTQAAVWKLCGANTPAQLLDWVRQGPASDFSLGLKRGQSTIGTKRCRSHGSGTFWYQ